MTGCAQPALRFGLLAFCLLLAPLVFVAVTDAMAQLSEPPSAAADTSSAHREREPAPASDGQASAPAAQSHDIDAPAKVAPPAQVAAAPEAKSSLSPLRSDLPRDLSPWGMFITADNLVKGVMIGLALAAMLTWTILLVKTVEFAGARASVRRTYNAVRKAGTLSDALQATQGYGGPAREMLSAAEHEAALSNAALDHSGSEGLKERVQLSLSRIEAAAGRQIGQGTGILATIGSVAPFVGLFGTVWGIMNSFVGISKAQTTNLAVVAPGIAEALLATAIGLVAAIPAVVIYNTTARRIQSYRALLGDVAAGVLCLLSRDLDYRKAPAGSVRFSQAAE